MLEDERAQLWRELADVQSASILYHLGEGFRTGGRERLFVDCVLRREGVAPRGLLVPRLVLVQQLHQR